MLNWRKAARNKRHRRIFLVVTPVAIALFLTVVLAGRGKSHAPPLNLSTSTLRLQDAASRAFSALAPSHGTVWLLPFDDRWRVLLGSGSCSAVPALSVSLSRGTSPREAATVLAERVLEGSAHRMIEVGAPFHLDPANNASITHVYAVPLDSADLGDGITEGARFVKPVRFAKTKEDDIAAEGCDLSAVRWVKRALAYSLVLMHQAKRVPRLNPMEEASFDDPLCCAERVRNSGDLSLCAKPCTAMGVFNILSVFPS